MQDVLGRRFALRITRASRPSPAPGDVVRFPRRQRPARPL